MAGLKQDRSVQTDGNCPSCHIGYLESEITWLGVLLFILLFPFGIIFLYLLQEDRCPKCGYST